MTPAELAALVEAALPANALGERLALSSLLKALELSQLEVEAQAAEIEQLRRYKREAVRFESSLASLVLERHETPAAPASPARLELVRP